MVIYSPLEEYPFRGGGQKFIHPAPEGHPSRGEFLN